MSKLGMSAIGGMLCLLAAGVVCATHALAGDDAAHNVELTERVNRIEEQLTENISPGDWTRRISLSGGIEFVAGCEKTDFGDPVAEDEDSSDFSLATVELGVDADIAEHVQGHVLFLYEDGEDILVDEGYILLDGEMALPLHLKAGEMYVPFGKFESHMISDPLTIVLGETRETAVEIGVEYAEFHGAVYAFNGDINKDGDDSRIDNFGASAGYAKEKDNFRLDIGMSWINNIVDSDGYSDIVAEEAEEFDDLGIAFAFRDYVPGIAAHAILSSGPATLIGEYISMLEKPQWNMTDVVPGSMAALGLDPVIPGDNTAAWNLELGYIHSLGGKETTFAVGVQGSKHGKDILPEKQYMVTASVGILEGTTLALEYRHDEYETNGKADALTTRLAIEF